MQTTTTKRVDPLNWDELEATYLKLAKEFEDLPSKFICHKGIYARLLQEAKDYRDGPYDGWTIFGMDVEVDPDMKPGEWKFEYRNNNARRSNTNPTDTGQAPHNTGSGIRNR